MLQPLVGWIFAAVLLWFFGGAGRCILLLCVCVQFDLLLGVIGVLIKRVSLLSTDSCTKMSYYNQGPPVGAPPAQYGMVATPF